MRRFPRALTPFKAQQRASHGLVAKVSLGCFALAALRFLVCHRFLVLSVEGTYGVLCRKACWRRDMETRDKRGRGERQTTKTCRKVEHYWIRHGNGVLCNHSTILADAQQHLPYPPPRARALCSTCNRSDGVLEHLLPPPDNGGEDGGGGGGSGGGGGGGAAIAFAVLRAMGTTLSEIENASLRLKPLVLSHAFTSPEELVQMLVAHYRGQASHSVKLMLASFSSVRIRPIDVFSLFYSQVDCRGHKESLRRVCRRYLVARP